MTYAAYWSAGELADAEARGIKRVAWSPLDDRCWPHWYRVQDDRTRINQQWKSADDALHEFHDHPASQHAGTADENDWDLLEGDLVRLTNQQVYDRFTGHDAVEFLYRGLRKNRDPGGRLWLSNAERNILSQR